MRQPQALLQMATICVRIRAHPAIALRCEFKQFSHWLSLGIKQFFGFVAVHPIFKQFQMRWIFLYPCEWNLMRSP